MDRPTRPAQADRPQQATQEPTQLPRSRRPLADDDLVKVSTMILHGQHKRLMMIKAQQGKKLEEMFQAAIEAYLKQF